MSKLPSELVRSLRAAVASMRRYARHAGLRLLRVLRRGRKRIIHLGRTGASAVHLALQALRRRRAGLERAARRRLPLRASTELAIGIAIVLFYHAVFGHTEANSLDPIIRIAALIDRPIAAPPIAAYSVDTAVWERWGEPQRTPRAQIARALEALARARPTAIILDIFLDGTTEEDAELRTVLENWGANGERPPDLFLARAFRETATVPYGYMFVGTNFDHIQNPYISWTSVVFTRDRFGTVRSKPHSVRACDGGQLKTLLTISHAVQQVLNGAPIATDVETSLLCARNSGAESGVMSRRDDGIVHRSSRIFFHLSSDEGAGGAPARYDCPRPVGALVAKPLSMLLPDAGDALRLECAVAIIGNSSAQAQDIWYTPIGPMPGHLLIGNAVRSQIAFGDIEPFGFWAGTCALCVLALVTWALYQALLRAPLVRTPIICEVVVGTTVMLAWYAAALYVFLPLKLGWSDFGLHSYLLILAFAFHQYVGILQTHLRKNSR